MQFKYFLYPDKFAIWLEGRAHCDYCKLEKRCFDGRAFSGSDKLSAICADCLLEGRIAEQDTFACEGDIMELQRQLQERKPDKSEKAVLKKAGEISDELERTTPPIFSHQSWYWPCMDSDYCTFLGYGSKSLYNHLSPEGNGLDLMVNSLYHTVADLTDAEELWDKTLPDLPIPSLAAARLQNTLFYVFISQKKDRLVTLWDRK